MGATPTCVFKNIALFEVRNLLTRLLYVDECSSFGMHHELQHAHGDMVPTKVVLAIRASKLLVAHCLLNIVLYHYLL